MDNGIMFDVEAAGVDLRNASRRPRVAGVKPSSS